MTRTDEFTPRRSTVWLPSGMPASASRSQAARASGRELDGVVEVRVDVEGMVATQHRAERVVDAHGEDHRDARADADDLDVRDGAHLRDDLLQPVGRQGQGIAPRDENVADGRGASDVVDGLAQVLAGDGRLLLPDQAPPVAVATIDGAPIDGQQQAAVRVAVEDTGRAGSARPRRAGSTRSPSSTISSSARGMTCIRIGHEAWARSMSEK